MKKKISVIIALVFMLCLIAMPVYAKEYNTYRSGSLCDCSIGVGVTSKGIAISYTTGATQKAAEIGCKDIVLQEKVNGSWKDISIPNGKTTNSFLYSHSYIYTGAVKGRAYRAHCTHYAIINGETITTFNECDSIVYN